MKRSLLSALFLGPWLLTAAQEQPDTSRVLEEVTVKGHFVERPLLRSPASAVIINQAQLQKFQDGSLVQAMNTAPGVRMEERSPGSYRLSIRGSLLRSPFGIRNIKLYLDGFSLTDAGGNSYLNLLDPPGIGRIEILKGPEASNYGANSGGVVLINTPSNPGKALQVQASGGSFGLFHQNASLSAAVKKHTLYVSQAHQQSEGYRRNSELKRNYFTLSDHFRYDDKGTIKVLGFYSDLNYQTPGGLTKVQMEQDPKSARPASGRIPGALEQQAGIINKTIFGGISHERRLGDQLSHHVLISAGHTDFQNPFITNYEVREESSLNIRTFFELASADRKSWKWDTGVELQRTGSDIDNYGNRQGVRDTMQASDRLEARQTFLFTQLSAELGRFLIEAGTSYNIFGYSYQSFFPRARAEARREFDNPLMPRIAASFLVDPSLSWRVSASRGYSPPSIAEVRASDNQINVALQAEKGWNLESGMRWARPRFALDASVFRFRLQDAIVRRINDSGTEYFLNAGGTEQSGVELSATGQALPVAEGLVPGVLLSLNYTFSNFEFRDYISGSANFSGNRLTGVPRNQWVLSGDFRWASRLSLYIQHSIVGSIPLDDANANYADRYQLLQAKLTWAPAKKPGGPTFFAGADNILDARYSLGNDLNAIGGRFFNPAASRNYYFGARIAFSRAD